jgi:phosphate transport system permease protein
MAVATDFSNPLTPSGNLPRRRLVDRIMRWSAAGAALLAVFVLGVVLYTVIKNGASVLSWHFFTQSAPIDGAGGGIAPFIIGTLLLVAAAAVVAVPLGVLIAIFLTEYAGPRAAFPVRLALDLLNGLPTIVIGMFLFGLLVVGHHQSGFAASLALAIIMVPLIARAAQEVLLLVPQSQRDASLALGMSRWRTTLGVVLPACVSGIITGTVLAVARAAGETAPLIALSSFFQPNTPVTLNFFGQAIPNITYEIFNQTEQANPADHARAWGAALVLMAMILIANFAARALLARSRRKMFR